MCMICEAADVANPPAVEEGPSTFTANVAKRNDDGTFTLTLTEKQMRNLMLRLAMSQVVMGS